MLSTCGWDHGRKDSDSILGSPLSSSEQLPWECWVPTLLHHHPLKTARAVWLQLTFVRARGKCAGLAVECDVSLGHYSICGFLQRQLLFLWYEL